VNLIAFAPLWLAALTAAALLAAAIEDVMRLRISNIAVLAVLFAAIAAMAFAGFHVALWENAAVFVGVLAVGTFAFARNWLGGGDVKLFAATGLWVGFEAAPWLLAAIFLAGGVVAILYIIVRKARGKKRSEANRIPYGVAIAAGALFVLGSQYSNRASERGLAPLPAIKGVDLPKQSAP
jgi:prepilin peptidase CpaA